MTSLVVRPANMKEYLLLTDILDKMQIDYSSSLQNEDKKDAEQWYSLSMQGLSRAYSEEEPEYTSGMVNEHNPEYKCEGGAMN